MRELGGIENHFRLLKQMCILFENPGLDKFVLVRKKQKLTSATVPDTSLLHEKLLIDLQFHRLQNKRLIPFLLPCKTG